MEINGNLRIYQAVADKAVKNYQYIDHIYEVKLLDYSENGTYIIEKTNSSDDKYILRVCRPNYHEFEEIKSEIEFAKSLDDSTSVNLCMPQKADNGEYVQRIVHEGKEYFTVLFNYIRGNMPNIDHESNLIKVFKNIGEITANFHLHSIENSEQFSKLKRPVWDYETILGDVPKWGRWQDGKGLTENRYDIFNRVSKTIKKRLDSFGKTKGHFGLIHADLRHTNLLVDEKNKVSVIDFDDSGFGYYLYDLAASLSFIEHREYVPKLIHSWIEGYNAVRRLSEAEVNEIPTFIMMRRLQLISWIGSRDNETSRELGSKYSEDSDIIMLQYLKKYE